MLKSQYLFKKTKNLGSGFFPDFPDPVFSRNFLVRVLAHTKFPRQIFTYSNLFHKLLKFIYWQALADAKNAINWFYIVGSIPEFPSPVPFPSLV